MKAVRNVLVLALVLAVAAPLMAAEKARRKGEKRERKAREAASIVPKEMLSGIELTAEQKATLEALNKELGPKLNEVRAQMQGVFTEEQKQARAEAEKAAKEAGKQGPELREAVEAAIQLTDEQKAKMAEVRKKMTEVQKQIREKVMALLTPEQQEIVKENMKKARGGDKKEGKKREKKPASE